MPKEMSKTAQRTMDDIKDMMRNEDMDQDVTHPYPEEMYLQEDQEIRGFSMGSRKAIKGYKYGGIK
jgi:hypothetical protein